MSIAVGPVSLSDPVILAPMSGVTDAPFRRLAKRFGAALVVSEMIAGEPMIRLTRRSLARARISADEEPVAVQLAGCEPAVMAEAARLNEDLGARIIDINFGCPVKKVVGGNAGSALMRDETRAARILEATVKAVRLPVTLKMRLGWDDASRNAPRLARIAEEAGIRMITVHGRTRCQLFSGSADWTAIRAVKAEVRVPVVANGDIASCEDARRALALSGADGVMIGRGAYGRPWFVGQVAQFLRTGRRLPDPAPAEQAAVALEHYDAMLSHYGATAGNRIARKHLAWYAAGRPGAEAMRAAVNRSDDPATVRDAVRRFFDGLIERRPAAMVAAA